MLKLPHAEEAHIVYSGGCPPRAGRSRKVPLSGKNMEAIAISFPVQRTKVLVTKKQHYTCCGEASTYCGRFSGVELRASAMLPLISPKEKQTIMGSTRLLQPPEDWSEKFGNDVPLFWQEGKSIGFWGALLDEFRIKSIFDVTPGSGALMEAALLRGIVYHGLCLGLNCCGKCCNSFCFMCHSKKN